MSAADDRLASRPPYVRPMRRGEADRVGALTLSAYDRYGRIDGDYRAFLADPMLRAERCSALLVAELDGAVVGTVTYVVPGDPEWEGRPEADGDAGFRVLAVDPAAEGRGAGRALVQACIDRARQEGRARLVITSMSWMTRAHALYAALGFVRRADLDVTFPAGRGLGFHLDLSPLAAERFAPAGPPAVQPPWYREAWRSG